jgi:type II secretory pathway component PulC
MRKSALSVSPRTVGLVLWLLSLAGLGLCGYLGLRLWRHEPPDVSPPSLPDLPALSAETEAGERKPVSAYLSMARNPLFGAPPPAQEPERKEVNLKVEAAVVGTIIHGDFSAAIVERPNGGQDSLRVGDSLEGGKVVEITSEGLILERQGRRILVPKRSSPGGGQGGAAQQQQASPRLISVGASPSAPESKEPKAELADIEFEEFDAFLERLKEGAESVTAKPAHDAGGNPTGLVFQSVPEDSVFAAMGLKDGDIVTAVNDIPVTERRELTGAFEEVATGIKRGEEVFIIIDLIRDQKADTIIQTIW